MERSTLIVLALTGIFVAGGVGMIVFGPKTDDAGAPVEANENAASATDGAKPTKAAADASVKPPERPPARPVPEKPWEVESYETIQVAAPSKPGEEEAEMVEMQYADLVVGDGPAIKSGARVRVEYTGFLQTDNTVFDSSYKRPAAATFPLKFPGLIKGWVDGMSGMKVGGKRQLVIPPALGYGEKGNRRIPGNSTLVFDIELLEAELPFEKPDLAASGWTTLDSGMKFREVKPGEGELLVEQGSVFSADFSAWVADQDESFQSTLTSRRPARSFVAGQGGFIEGLDTAWLGLKKGAVREVFVPAALGYGERGSGKYVPPNSDLLYVVKINDVKEDKRLGPKAPEADVTYAEAELPGTEGQKYKFADLEEGNGPIAEEGWRAMMDFVVFNSEGTIIENTYSAVRTPAIPLSGARSRPYMTSAAGMKGGGRRQVEMPVSVAYGKTPLPAKLAADDTVTIVFMVKRVSPPVTPPPSAGVPGVRTKPTAKMPMRPANLQKIEKPADK